MTAASPEPTDGPWTAPAASGANPASGDGTWAPPPNPPTGGAVPPPNPPTAGAVPPTNPPTAGAVPSGDAPHAGGAWTTPDPLTAGESRASWPTGGSDQKPGHPATDGMSAPAGADPAVVDGTFTPAEIDSYGPFVPEAPPVPLKQRLAAAVLTAAVVAVIGAPLGLLWSVVAPGVPIIKTDDGAVFATPSPEEFIASDGWFTILLFSLGLLAALVTWVFFKRFRGPWTLAGLVVGTVGASILAWQVGRRIGIGAFHDAVAAAHSGDLIIRPPDLRAGGFTKLWDVIPFVHGDLLMATFGAVIMYTLLAGWSRTPSLRPEPAAQPQPAVVNPFYTLGEVQGPQAPPPAGELADPGR
ncbi:uncharacterized protein DUF2567 [Asanoa ferruginea]|uniref:Uncharacterized protein DUF2567 n=1 Tax=Asanoa ferruginea TaxID=53367 RepID=A0A3D9ZY93_9ACTN|nr:DUF2567 domain-containing protein [Asanoa ferruginea]REG02082.1 uncharacterized protein DUF2567 [Asanoa ferruginea]GIF48622.1 hypothetical protein Afe04nite_31610 [Asanoa ferruginea]